MCLNKTHKMENAAQNGKITSYFETLRIEISDSRGQQGKVHDIAFVLSGVLLAVLVGKRRIAEIHRWIANQFDWLKETTGFLAERPVSDAQLRRILRGVDYEGYNETNRRYFDVEVKQIAANEWISIDGKELRGSLEINESGKKDYRGEVTVNAVRHKDNQVVAQSFYRGDKESEKLAVREMLERNGLKEKSVTLDALHCDPATTAQIEQAKGRYIVQVKGNQEELLEDLQQVPRFTRLSSTHESFDKAHGRIEKRRGMFYSVEGEHFDSRWQDSGLRSLGVVFRQTVKVKTGEVREDTSYYVSNQSLIWSPEEVGEELFMAIRRHWAVEADNYVRDVTMGEDKVKTPKGALTRTLAVARTWAVQLLRKSGATNLKAQMECFADKKEDLYKFLKIINFST